MDHCASEETRIQMENYPVDEVVDVFDVVDVRGCRSQRWKSKHDRQCEASKQSTTGFSEISIRGSVVGQGRAFTLLFDKTSLLRGPTSYSQFRSDIFGGSEFLYQIVTGKTSYT